jgi:Tfp pilus tip-associated adhesin PilY1
MKTKRSGSRIRLVAAIGVAIALAIGALLVPSGELSADDRDLLRTSSGEPYVFVLFDATGSMVRIPANNTILANNVDDDPGSKLYQAKQALYSVIDQTNGVNFGFATFPNQTGLAAVLKRCGGDCICRNTPNNSCSGTTSAGSAGSLQFNSSDHCGSWEPNDDTNADKAGGYTYHASTFTNARGLQVGDVIPLDWGDDNVERLKERLAPNLALGETTPDFGIARYFRDSQLSGENHLRLQPGVPAVFMAHGLTNLGTAMRSFREWYDDWKPLAQANDPQFSCRKVFVLLMTDGFETCNNANAETEAQQLLANRGIQTYVVGFATNSSTLNDIAEAGGTQQAFFPSTQEELIEDFSEILIQVQNKARTFTSATVPSVVGRAGRQIFHTSFNPSQQKGLWPGRIDAFQRPVPLTDVNGAFLPDYRIACSGANDTACQIWDAGTEMLNQSPTQSNLTAGDLKLGNSPNQRRVYYRDQDGERAFFAPKSDTDDRLWLYGNPGFGFGTFISTSEANQSSDIIKKTLVQKTTIIQNPFTGSDQNKTYVLGDIFHSDPVVVDVPKNFRYFAEGVVAREEFCGPRFDGVEDSHVPYPCFVQHQQGRRRVLLLGSNDGQLHAIDAGQSYFDSNDEIQYGVGTGRELFSFIPRAVLPTVRELAEDDDHRYSVDGSVTVDDAVIGEEWRTVVVGGLREGGRAYYALDITQPDTIGSDDLPSSTSYVPSCVDGGNGCAIEADLGDLGPFEEAEYPRILWEFEENFDTSFATDGVDEDGNGKADLGDTWSKPNTGRILVCDTNCDPLDPDNDIETRYVAVFGGGMDPDFKRDPIDEGLLPLSLDDTWNPWSGNWLYMVDIGTGEILYKRKLDQVSGLTIGSEYPASTPSEPSAVDINQDSYLDTIYIGTTAGFLYKVDISSPQPIVSTTVPDYSRNAAGAPRSTGQSPLMMSVNRITDSDWAPFQIFDTGGRPIYYPPSVIFVASLGQYALGFGTGDREDLWSETTQEGRYYLFLDTGFTPTSAGIPLTESVLQAISPDLSESPNTAEDFLLAPDADHGKVPGWVMTFESEERVLDRSFALSGVLFLTTFTPNLGIASPGQCSTTGTSRVFTLFVNNANAVGEERYIGVPDLVTRPWVEPGETYDTLPAGNPPPPPAEGICDSAELQAITQTLKNTVFPPACDFANYTLNIMTIRSETGVECVAPVPLCIIRRNWKEF